MYSGKWCTTTNYHETSKKIFSKVGDTYTDKTDLLPVAWKAVAVTKQTVRTHRVGTAIQWYYRVYNTVKYSSQPHSVDDYQHISCNEVYKSPNVRWSGLIPAKQYKTPRHHVQKSQTAPSSKYDDNDGCRHQLP